jgi:hypothetical protein
MRFCLLVMLADNLWQLEGKALLCQLPAGPAGRLWQVTRRLQSTEKLETLVFQAVLLVFQVPNSAVVISSV